LSSLLGIAGLGRAVANTVGPVGLATEASNVTRGAVELGVGDAGHVVGAQLSTRSKGLGNGNTGDGGKDSEGLHLEGGGVWW
jgi:hypothetical protein